MWNGPKFFILYFYLCAKQSSKPDKDRFLLELLHLYLWLNQQLWQCSSIFVVCWFILFANLPFSAGHMTGTFRCTLICDKLVSLMNMPKLYHIYISTVTAILQFLQCTSIILIFVYLPLCVKFLSFFLNLTFLKQSFFYCPILAKVDLLKEMLSFYFYLDKYDFNSF